MGVFMNNSTQSFDREWALRLIRCCIEASALGKTSLEIVKDKMRETITSYSVSPDEIKIITNLITQDLLLKHLIRELRKERIKPLTCFVKQLARGDKSSG